MLTYDQGTLFQPQQGQRVRKESYRVAIFSCRTASMHKKRLCLRVLPFCLCVSASCQTLHN